MAKTKAVINVPNALPREQVEFQVYNIISDLESYDMEFEIQYVDDKFFDINVIENNLPENVVLIKFYFGWEDENKVISEIASKCMYALRKEIKKDSEYKKIFIGLWSDKNELVAVDRPEFDLSIYYDIISDVYLKIKSGEKVYWDEIDEYMDINGLEGQTFVELEDDEKTFKRNTLQVFYKSNPEIKSEMKEFDPKTVKNIEFLEIIKELHKSIESKESV